MATPIFAPRGEGVAGASYFFDAGSICQACRIADHPGGSHRQSCRANCGYRLDTAHIAFYFVLMQALEWVSNGYPLL